MRFTTRLPFVALVFFLAASPLAAQDTGAEAPAYAAVQEPAGEAAAGAPAVAAPAGDFASLPERAAPPRTLRDYWHVFIAFALAWVLLFGYVVSLGRRFARVEDGLRRLGGVPAE